MSKLNFHVRHEVTPDRVWGVLEAIGEDFEYDHITQSSRQLSRLRQLGLVTDDKQAALTETGKHVYQLGTEKPTVLSEVFHFLHYTRWTNDDPLENTMFFTYRAYCDMLYDKGTVELSNDNRQEFAAELNGVISSHFSDQLHDLVKGAVSLSTNTLRGVEHWLSGLSPAVLEDDVFECRHFCVAELFVLALGLVTQQSNVELHVDQLLSPEKRDVICRICLLDKRDFDQTLDWIMPAYPDVVQPGTTAGSYGRFIRMLKIPTIEDVIR
jgi:hypothetical protein